MVGGVWDNPLPAHTLVFGSGGVFVSVLANENQA